MTENGEVISSTDSTPSGTSSRGSRVVAILAVTALVVLGINYSLSLPGIASAPVPYIPPASHRGDDTLDASWQFSNVNVEHGPEAVSFRDSDWQTVNLPHTWNNLDGQDGGNNYRRGAGWYRRHITPDISLEGRKLFLQFDGANTVTELYINGVFVGQHEGGFAAFRFDVTEFLVVGRDNVVTVKVDNAPHADIPPLSADFTFFGGLYRHVRLISTDRVALTSMDFGSSGVYIKQTEVSDDSAHCQMTARVSNTCGIPKSVRVTCTVVDAAGNPVLTRSATGVQAPGSTVDYVQRGTIYKPHLWNGRSDPYLYRVYVEIDDGATPTDLVWQPLGFRSFSVDREGGFFLNGRYLDLHGVNKHQDRMNKGWAISEADMDEDFAMMMELGATAIRLAHYQHPQHEYDLADREGLIVWAEIPLVNRITASSGFARNADQQLIEMIRQNYNHPSIAFWGIANEITLQAGPDPDSLLNALARRARAEDPTRLNAIASNAADTNRTSFHTDVTGFNKYFGWYGGDVKDFARWADGIHATPSLDFRKIGVTEYGAGASIRYHSENPVVNDHTEEYQNYFHETYWNAMKERPFLWGKFVWNMFDFAVDGRDEGDAKGRNDKGLVTYDRRTKKDSFYWYKANWSDEPVVYITGRRFNPRQNITTTVKVYANMDSVLLELNGISLGTMVGPERIFSWPNVALKPGSNRVRAVGRKGSGTWIDQAVWVLQ